MFDQFFVALLSDAKLVISGAFNVKNFNEGGHKFGMGLEYEPCC